MLLTFSAINENDNTLETNVINPCDSFNAPLSAAKAPKSCEGYDSIRNIAII